jgi:hypothetical protein
MKTLSIIGIVLSALSFLCACLLMQSDSVAAIGWGMYAAIYLMAFSIVALVKLGRKKN